MLLHTVVLAHVRSEVAVLATPVYVVGAGHTVRLVHCRSTRSVGAAVSNSAGVHAVTFWHTRSEVGVVAVTCTVTPAVHLVYRGHTRSVVAVGPAASNAVDAQLGVTAEQLRSDVAVGAATW